MNPLPTPSSQLAGPQYLLQGLSLIWTPGLRLFVILPLLINLLLFGLMLYWSVQGFDGWLHAMLATLPSWLDFLAYVLWPLFVLLLLIMIFFSFTLIANLIAAPFNGLLAEKVEVLIRGQDNFPAFSMAELLALVPRTLGRELRKLLYFLPRATGLLLLSLIPGVNLLASPLWLLWGSWMMCVQYLDYPADNHKLGWQDMLSWLRARRWKSLGFGGSVYLALWVPGLNLIMMPAAIAGATLFWVREHDTPAKELSA